MAWLKAFHLFFVVSWFAGLFYLPRLFVYHAQARETACIERYRTMERRLYRLMTVAGTFAVAFGLGLLAAGWWRALPAAGWLQIKLVLVGVLVAFHLWCGREVRRLSRAGPAHGDRFYRLINELPALLLAAIVVLASVRPF
ncbi:MAG TPA: TIGR00701 family protein [Chromatiales bacterium]|nr:TIGR00701 family protein [Chromatiales bacterium]